MGSCTLKLVGVLAIILFANAIIGSDASSSFENPVPKDPWFGLRPLPKQPRPGFYKFLGDCIDRMTRECGMKMFDAVFHYKDISDASCCDKIVNMPDAYLCNRSLQFTLGLFDKFRRDAAFISDRSNIVYEDCKKIAHKRI